VNSTPDKRGDERGQEAPGSIADDPFVRQIVRAWEPRIDEDDRPEDEPPGRFTFAEQIDQEAMSYRAWGSPVGDFLARVMETTAQLVRWTRATTPQEHEDRMEVWDAVIRERWEARGFEEGRRQCRCQAD
jgi:hypothetical protein